MRRMASDVGLDYSFHDTCLGCCECELVTHFIFVYLQLPSFAPVGLLSFAGTLTCLLISIQNTDASVQICMPTIIIRATFKVLFMSKALCRNLIFYSCVFKGLTMFCICILSRPSGVYKGCIRMRESM